jgi:hypothetical protein
MQHRRSLSGLRWLERAVLRYRWQSKLYGAEHRLHGYERHHVNLRRLWRLGRDLLCRQHVRDSLSRLPKYRHRRRVRTVRRCRRGLLRDGRKSTVQHRACVPHARRRQRFSLLLGARSQQQRICSSTGPAKARFPWSRIGLGKLPAPATEQTRWPTSIARNSVR